MPKHDYRTTRAGRSGPGELPDTISEFQVNCPVCMIQTEHALFQVFVKSRRARLAVCGSCGFKRFWGWIDPNPLSNPDDDEKSRKMQALKQSLWGWLANHLDEIFSVSVPRRVYNYSGRLGSPQRNKGKPAFGNVEFAPEFIKYLNTPDAIKSYSEGLMRLARENEELYAFIYFKASGFSYADMSGFFQSPLVRKTAAKGPGKGGRKTTEKCDKMLTMATRYLFELAPDNLRRSFGNEEMLVNRFERKKERVVCPMCDGREIECILCFGDGHVSRSRDKQYRNRIASGGTWEPR